MNEYVIRLSSYHIQYDCLRQSAQDIITILSNQPSITAPSLTVGDPVRNELLEIAQQLGRVEPLTVPNKKDTDNTSPPRVYDPQSLSFDAQLPRVNASSSLTNSIATRNTSPEVDINTSVLEPQSGIIKSNRFRNAVNHRYPLRSLQKHVANHTPTLSHESLFHIFDVSGK